MCSFNHEFDSDGKRIKCLSSSIYSMLSEENGYSKHNLEYIYQMSIAFISNGGNSL